MARGFCDATEAFESGQSIDGGHLFLQDVDHWYYYRTVDENNTYTNFAPGERAYMGVRFSGVDGWHYGWIGVTYSAHAFSAFAWGYETAPGVPIAAGAPAPGTVAALAFGAAAISSRKRRQDVCAS